jgi:hypothetical protein
MLHVRVQAASWVDVDAIEIVVGGMDPQVVPILPGDADPTRPWIRFEDDLPLEVTTDTYVIVAAYGDASLEPVHRGRTPFGVANPIFLTAP